jgi:anti-sigma factor (TIGR02949 family)
LRVVFCKSSIRRSKGSGTDSGAAHPRGESAGAGDRPEQDIEDRVKCSEVISQLSDYLDAEAARELCDTLEAHLAECPQCRVNIDTVRKTISLYRSEWVRDCPEQVRVRLFTILSFEYRKK